LAIEPRADTLIEEQGPVPASAMRICIVDTDRCWELIEAARADAGVVWHGLAEHALDKAITGALVQRLVRMTAGDIAAFEVRFARLQARLDRDDVYMAAFLLTHGCGDDGFSDFRAGIVGLGRRWYDLVLRDPDNLAGHPAVQGIITGEVDQHVLRTETFQYAADSAYEQVTGIEDALYDHVQRLSPTMTDDLGPPPTAPPIPRRLPRLAAMFPRAQTTLDRLHPNLTGTGAQPI
jgi:hypothetical protein